MKIVNVQGKYDWYAVKLTSRSMYSIIVYKRRPFFLKYGFEVFTPVYAECQEDVIFEKYSLEELKNWAASVVSTYEKQYGVDLELSKQPVTKVTTISSIGLTLSTYTIVGGLIVLALVKYLA